MTTLRSKLSSFRSLIFANKLSAFGTLSVVFFIVLALIYLGSGGRSVPFNPNAFPNLGEANLPPSTLHLFGTDFAGRDILSRVIAALPIDLGLPLAVVLISASIGIFLGTITGYFRGIADEAIMRFTDIFLAFPTIIMVLAIAATLGPSLVFAMLALVFVWWPPYVRLVRGQVMQVSAEDFVSASKALNSSFFYILRKNIIPNVLPSVIVYATMDVGTALLTISTIGYLGIGIPADTPELGIMVASISSNLYTYPWEAILPGIVVLVIATSFSFLGDGLRESLDVKLRPHILFRNKAVRDYTKETEEPIGLTEF